MGKFLLYLLLGFLTYIIIKAAIWVFRIRKLIREAQKQMEKQTKDTARDPRGPEKADFEVLDED
jgi:hypothetical protein